jgi:hypothetical protein
VDVVAATIDLIPSLVAEDRHLTTWAELDHPEAVAWRGSPAPDHMGRTGTCLALLTPAVCCLRTSSMWPTEPRHLTTVFTAYECSTFAVVPAISNCTSCPVTAVADCTYAALPRLHSPAVTNSTCKAPQLKCSLSRTLPSLSEGSCAPLISVNSETSILWLLAVHGSSETWVP